MPSERAPARERDHLLERLHNLRTILPAFAEELAGARRQASRLRLDNARLAKQVRALQRQRGEAARGPLDAAGSVPQTGSGMISMAPHGHSSTHMPQPLQ
jgi:hypothetical protein